MQNNSRLKMLILAGMFAAITAILAQVEIPLPYVPISGQTLAVGLTVTILGSRYGALSMIVYACLGAVGVPVFAGMTSGLGVLIGPTGGYIIGFIIAAYIMGIILERTSFNFTWAMISNTIGMIIILLVGTIQLKYVSSLTWNQAFIYGIYPFIVVGLIKAALASWLGIVIRKRLISSRIMTEQKVETTI